MTSTQQQLHPMRLDPDDWVEAYGDSLFRYAFSRLNDAGAAEEVLQETFLAALRNQHQFDGSGPQQGWLIGILKRKIVDFIRARTRSKEVSMNDEFDATALLFDEHGRWKTGALPLVGPDEQLQASELRSVVQACLKDLPRGQADVFVLFAMEEMESEEICKELGITTTNLWVRLHRARLGLARCVGSKWFLDGKGARSRE